MKFSNFFYHQDHGSRATFTSQTDRLLRRFIRIIRQKYFTYTYICIHQKEITGFTDMELKKIRIVLLLELIFVSSNELATAFVPQPLGRLESHNRFSQTRLESALNKWEKNLADSALLNVQNLAASVTRANDNDTSNREDDADNIRGTGDTKSVYSYLKYQSSFKGQNRQVVLNALQCLERDSEFSSF